MISLAVFHGFNGLRQVLDEYVDAAGRRVIVAHLDLAADRRCSWASGRTRS